MARRQRDRSGWRGAQPPECVAVRLRGDAPPESLASGVAYADVVRDQRHAGLHLLDFLPPVRPDAPDCRDPPRYRERYGRGLRRGELRRGTPDQAHPLHGTRLDLATRIAAPDHEHHAPAVAPRAPYR